LTKKLENLKDNYDYDTDAINKINVLLAKRQSYISNLSQKDINNKINSTAKLSSHNKDKDVTKTENSLHKEDKDNVNIGEIIKTEGTKKSVKTLSLNPSGIELIKNRYDTEGIRSEKSRIEIVKTENLFSEIKEDIDKFEELERSQFIRKEKGNIITHDS